MTDIVKLDKIDRKILFELDKNCRIPATILARKVRRSRQSVEYRIRELVRKGVILQFNAYFNFERLGYRIQRVFLRLKNVPDEKRRLISYLRQSPSVFWMAECYGAWDVLFTVFYKSDFEFHDLKNDLFSSFRNVIVEQYADILLEAEQYPKMFLTNEISKPYYFGGDVSEPQLDSVDRRILGLLAYESNLGVNEIARQTQSTPRIVRSRIKGMEDEGLIIHYFITVDLSKIGLEQHKSLIRLDRYTKQDEAKLLEYVSKIPNTTFYVKTLWHIEIEFVVENYAIYYSLIDDLKKEFSDIIKSVDSMFVIKSEVSPGFDNLLEGSIRSRNSPSRSSR